MSTVVSVKNLSYLSHRSQDSLFDLSADGKPRPILTSFATQTKSSEQASSFASSTVTTAASLLLSGFYGASNMLMIPDLADRYINENTKAAIGSVLATGAGVALHVLGDVVDEVIHKAQEYDLGTNPRSPVSSEETLADESMDETNPHDLDLTKSEKGHHTWDAFVHRKIHDAVCVLEDTGLLSKEMYRDGANRLISFLLPWTSNAPDGITPVSTEALSSVTYNIAKPMDIAPLFVFSASSVAKSIADARKDISAARGIRRVFKAGVLEQCGFAGTGYAAVVASAMCLGINIEEFSNAFDNFEQACEQRFLGSISATNSGLRHLLDKLLADFTDTDIRSLTENRLFISLSACHPGRGFHAVTMENEVRDSFRSKDELRDVILAACYIPLQSEATTTLRDAKATVYLCGAYTENRMFAENEFSVFLDGSEGDVEDWVAGMLSAGLLSVTTLRDLTQFL
ncbi:hypothetical protein BJ742DRAFT_856502 [Cladochytrium replicatum]|nr:hypothetical protein BJ742DRAFT_856502 [Cladochytrium replicatum]